MKHARPDYNRIQDPAGLIPEDEPVLLLRGQDRAAPATVRYWADEAEALGADPEICEAARKQASAMEAWQDHAPGVSKVPDLPAAGSEPDLVPTPTDEVSSIAGRVLATDSISDPVQFIADAKKLAGFALRSDRQAGPNG